MDRLQMREDALVMAEDEFIVDTSGLDRVAQVEAVRQTLDVIAEDAATIETDIPWAEARGWSDEVEAAARRLGTLLSDKDPMYQMTGIVPATKENWQSFHTFAPFAHGALVRAVSGRLIATVDDEGTAIWALLNGDQRASLAHHVPFSRQQVGRGQVVVASIRWKVNRRDSAIVHARLRNVRRVCGRTLGGTPVRRGYVGRGRGRA